MWRDKLFKKQNSRFSRIFQSQPIQPEYGDTPPLRNPECSKVNWHVARHTSFFLKFFQIFQNLPESTNSTRIRRDPSSPESRISRMFQSQLAFGETYFFFFEIFSNFPESSRVNQFNQNTATPPLSGIQNLPKSTGVCQDILLNRFVSSSFLLVVEVLITIFSSVIFNV